MSGRVTVDCPVCKQKDAITGCTTYEFLGDRAHGQQKVENLEEVRYQCDADNHEIYSAMVRAYEAEENLQIDRMFATLDQG